MQFSIDDLIEYLQTLPKETNFSFLRQVNSHSHDHIEEVPLDLDPVKGNVYFVDLTGNPFIKPGSSLENKKYLLLGEL